MPPPDDPAVPNADTGIDWEQVQRAVEAEEEYTDECGNQVKALFLGSVFSLSPSGKYYTPFASGNVTEDEAQADMAWFEAVEEEAGKHGLSIESAEGDPTELMVIKVLGDNENPSCERDKAVAAQKRRPHL